MLSCTDFKYAQRALHSALQATTRKWSEPTGISSDNMKLLGLAVSKRPLPVLAGGMLAQYQGYSDVGMGVGMVVIGLASVIIGEVIFGTRNLIGGSLRWLWEQCFTEW